MARVEVILKRAEIDGKPISWNVLEISGSINGKEQILEIKLDRTQAMLAGMILDSKEDLRVANGARSDGQHVEVRKVAKDDSENWLI